MNTAAKLQNALGQVAHVLNRLDNDRHAAEEALTQHFEAMLTELAKRFPKRRFQANSGNGSIGVDITPGPWHPLEHHRHLQSYTWSWNSMYGDSHTWEFLWGEWEELLDGFAKQADVEYINFTRDIDIKGKLYREPIKQSA